ncbi:MAG: Hsp20/alpha crystallin family protein [Chitinophagaceae bacterium]|nr:Hsp20/alpha crystallin family protein [Chitinophagaceae bacterium]
MITFSNQTKTASDEYPGAYHPPAYNWTKVMQQLKETSEKHEKPSLKTYEDADCYSIEMNVPGYNKEDFIVMLDGDLLSIYGLCPNIQPGRQPGNPLQEGSYGCFEHIINLPKYIDADFVRAEYKSGMLRFDFLKSGMDSPRTISKIVVY